MGATLTERVKLLELQQAMIVETIKLVLQARWTGEMPHAEGLLKALNPADTDWSTAPIPRPN